MHICAYCRYKVKHTYTYSYTELDYDDFQTETFTEEFEKYGSEFLELLLNDIQDKDFCEINFTEGIIYVSLFNISSGNSTERIYEILEVTK